MKTGPKGLDLIKGFEGCKLTAYQDATGVWTCGFGSTGPHVIPGLVITQQQADEWLARDLARFEAAVARLVTVPLTQEQFDALVSWTFNLGDGALARSTLLKKLNAGDYAAVPDEMRRWTQAGGQILAGLVRRREAEAALWSSAPSPAVASQTGAQIALAIIGALIAAAVAFFAKG